MSSPAKTKESYAKPNKQKYMKPCETITDETVIPAMPSLLLQQPQHHQVVQKCQKLKDEMTHLSTVLKNFIEETIAVIKNKKSQTRISIGPLQNELDEKIKKFKDVKVYFDEARAVLEEKKRLFDLQQEKCDKIKLKMKNNNGSGEQIRNEIQELKDTISDTKISVKQEKDIVQKISQLEQILPFAAQSDDCQKVLKELLNEKKAAQVNYFKFKDETTELKTKLNKIREGINEFQNMTAEEQQQVQPIIDAKRADIDGKIAIIKEKITELNKKYDEDKQNYEAQQALILKIDWMKKEQKAFVLNKKNEEKKQQLKEKRQKDDEEEKTRREAEEKELADDPYNENVTICTLLIDYCKKLQPKQAKQEQQENKVKVDVESVITGKAWKKDNVSLVVSRKDQDLDYAIVTGKRNKKQNKPQETVEKQRDEHLNHQVEVLNYFEHVRVSPPIFTKQLTECIKLLEEKKEYFAQQPKETSQKENEHKKHEKKERQPKQQTPAVFQDSSFPTL